MSSVEAAPSGSLGRVLLAIGAVVLAHAGYSIYEHRVLLREAGQHYSPLQTSSTPEAFLGLLVVICGISLTATLFKPIAWQDEMRVKSIDDMNSMPGFIQLNSRASCLFTDQPAAEAKNS